MKSRDAALDISVVVVKVRILILVKVISILSIAALASRGTSAVCSRLVENYHISFRPNVLAEPYGLVAALPLRPPLLSQDGPHS